MSQSALQQGPTESSSSPLAANGLQGGESLLALTRDEVLIQTLASVAPEHALHVVDGQADLSERLASEPAGVAILDTSAVEGELTQLTRRLRAQFPDLVLIVAGGPPDQALLSAQIAQGTVYRFLHKPVSAQRVKLFVDAAWKRHDVEHANTGTFAQINIKPPIDEPTVPRSVLLGVGAALLGVLIFTVWHAFSTSQPAVATAPSARAPVAQPPKTVLPAAPSAAQKLQDLLNRADAALARGTLVGPPDENAGDLYGEVLAQDPTNARARAGRAQVLDQLLTGAEQALLAEHLDQAMHLTDAARALQPDNVRVAFLVAQIAKEREREHPPSRAAAASQPAPAAKAKPAPSDSDKVTVLLAQARTALAVRELGTAEQALLAAADAGASPEAVAPLQRQLQSLRLTAKADALAHYADLFNQRLAQGRLLEPPGDSARFYLEQLQAAEPTHPSTVLARDTLAARLLEETRKANAASDVAGAKQWLAAARTVGAPAAEVASLEQAIARGADAAASAVFVESQMQRVHYVAPVYPPIADQLGRRGVVEMEYTVRTDGSVADLAVTHAEPPGIFDRAATQAVRQWRYRPAMHSGQAVDQRVKLRIVFAPSS